MAKMGNKMIALCSLAVGAVYTSGYIVTQPKTTLAAQTQTNKNTSPFDSNSNTSHYSHHYRGHQRKRSGGDSQQPPGSTQQTPGTTQQSPSTTQQSPGTSQKSSGTATQGNYKDGTYTGVGTNQIGSVQVAVKISKGKIASVSITNCSTSYSESNIGQLPSEVVTRQSSSVDNVSGATRSTEDFQSAVQMALDKAKA